MSTTTTTDWRVLAVELAEVAAELVTVANGVEDAAAVPPIDAWLVGMMKNNAAEVLRVVDRIREANATPAEPFDVLRDNLPAMSQHMTTPERTAEVVQWLVAACGWDGVADAMANHAAGLLKDSPELLVECGGREALLSVLRLANQLAEADA